MNLMFYRLFIISFLPLVFCSCGARNGSAGKVTEMEFIVDSSLVDKSVSDSSLFIHYAVPGSWTPVPTTDSASMLLHQAGQISLRQLLKNDGNTVVFSVTDVRLVHDSVFRKLDEQYKAILNPTGQWSNVEKADFITAGYQVKQFVLSRPGHNNFKLLFAERGKPQFQFDYSIVVDSSYAINTKTLESIVGSLRRYH